MRRRILLFVTILVCIFGSTLYAADSLNEQMCKAAYDGNIDFVKVLLKKGVSVDCRDSDGWTPLMNAARNGRIDIVKLLISKNADVNLGDNIGWTALMRAVKGDQRDVIKILLQSGASVTKKNKDGKNALDIAKENGFSGVITIFDDFIQDKETRGKLGLLGDKNVDDLCKAAYEGRLEAVKWLLNKGVDINGKDSSGWTPLMNAARNGYIEIVNLLIEKGANLNAKDVYGRTALMLATKQGQLETVKLLIAKNANIYETNDYGQTVLDIATEANQAEILELLNVFWANSLGPETRDIVQKYGNDAVKIINTYGTKSVKLIAKYGTRPFAQLVERYGIEGKNSIDLYGEQILASGKPDAAPYPIVELKIAKEFEYGDVPAFKISINNKGKGVLYRLVGCIKTNSPLKDRNYIFFGMIKPGEVVERVYEFKKTALENAGQNIDFEVSFEELNDNIPDFVKGSVRIRSVSPEIVANNMFNLGKKYTPSDIFDLYRAKLISEQNIQRYVLTRANSLSNAEIIGLAKKGIDLRPVVDKLIKFSKRAFTTSEIIELVRVNAVSPSIVNDLLMTSKINCANKDIVTLAQLNSVSRNVVDYLYKNKKVSLSKEDIAYLVRANKLSGVNILYTYKIIDDGSGKSVGNGDGKIQKGEGIDLQLTLKNSGIFRLENVAIGITSPISALDVANSQQVLAVFNADENKTVVANFIVKRTLQINNIQFNLQATDNQFGVVLNENISIPLDKALPEQIIAINKKVASKAAARVFSGADTASTVIAKISEGAVFNVTGELNGMYRIAINNDYGWVEKGLTGDYSEQIDTKVIADNTADTSDDKAAIVKVFENAKPEVFIVSPDNNANINANEVDLVVEGRDRANGIASFLIKVNDMPIQGSTERGLVLVQKGDMGKVRKQYRLTLKPGLNKVEVIAFNGKFIESNPEIIYIVNTGRKIKPNLWILSIGVSKYKNQDYNLSYADVDAKTIAETFATQTGKLFDKVNVKVLVNEEVTREAIMQAKEDFLGKASSDDMIMIFFAGHGVLDKNNKYYFLTSDTDALNPSVRGISQSSLKDDILASVVANKSIFMFDTCYSGSITKAVTRGVQDIDKVIEDLYKGTGQFIMSASRGNEFAYEKADWGNGAFTRAVNLALKDGKADVDKDGFVDIFEFQKYVNEAVPEMTAGKQHPKTTNIDFDNIKFYSVQ